jgi:hypothetical protein
LLARLEYRFGRVWGGSGCVFMVLVFRHLTSIVSSLWVLRWARNVACLIRRGSGSGSRSSGLRIFIVQWWRWRHIWRLLALDESAEKIERLADGLE